MYLADIHLLWCMIRHGNFKTSENHWTWWTADCKTATMWIKWRKWLELPSCQLKIPPVHVHPCRELFRCWRIKRPFLLFHQGQKPCRPLDLARRTFLGILAAHLWRQRRWPPRDGPPGRTKMQAPATPIVVFSIAGFSPVDISSKCGDEEPCCVATFALAPALSWRNILSDDWSHTVRLNYGWFVQLQLRQLYGQIMMAYPRVWCSTRGVGVVLKQRFASRSCMKVWFANPLCMLNSWEMFNLPFVQSFFDCCK